MRNRLLGGVVSLVALLLAFSSLRGQQANNPDVKTETKIVEDLDKAKLLMKQGIPGVMVCSSKVKSITAIGRQGGFDVSVVADVFESRPEVSYVWGVRIFDETRKIKFFDHKYLDQKFHPKQFDGAPITFDERFDFLPGDYRAQVGLYEVREGMNLDLFKDETKESPYSAFVRTVKVTVPR